MTTWGVTMTELTAAQLTALSRMQPGKEYTTYQLGCTGATMNGLVRRTFVEAFNLLIPKNGRTGYRTMSRRSYRLTRLGVARWRASHVKGRDDDDRS